MKALRDALRGNAVLLLGFVLGCWLALWADLLRTPAQAQDPGAGYLGAPGITGIDVQAWSAELDAIAAQAGTGLLARTANDTWTTRTIASTSSGLVVTNGGGVAGAPSFALEVDLQAISALTSAADRIPYATGANTWALATYTAAARTWDAHATTAAQTAALDPATSTLRGIVFTTASRIYWAAGVTGAADTNQPAAKQEWATGSTTRRQPTDLTGRTSARLSGSFAGGAAGSKYSVQYSLDSGTTWVYLDGTVDGTPIGAATPQIPGDVAALALQTSAWATIVAAARTEVLLRIVSSGGDGVLDPTPFFLWLEYR